MVILTEDTLNLMVLEGVYTREAAEELINSKVVKTTKTGVNYLILEDDPEDLDIEPSKLG